MCELIAMNFIGYKYILYNPNSGNVGMFFLFE